MFWSPFSVLVKDRVSSPSARFCEDVNQSRNHVKKNYLVPDSVSVQGDDDHGRVGQEALVVEGQVLPLPRHIQHVPTSQRNGQICVAGTPVLCHVMICIFMYRNGARARS